MEVANEYKKTQYAVGEDYIVDLKRNIRLPDYERLEAMIRNLPPVCFRETYQWQSEGAGKELPQTPPKYMKNKKKGKDGEKLGNSHAKIFYIELVIGNQFSRFFHDFLKVSLK